MKKKTSVTLDQEVLEWLKEQAYQLDRSVSWLVNDVIKKAITDAQKEKENG